MVYGPIAYHDVYTSIYFFIHGVGIPDAPAAPAPALARDAKRVANGRGNLKDLGY